MAKSKQFAGGITMYPIGRSRQARALPVRRHIDFYNPDKNTQERRGRLMPIHQALTGDFCADLTTMLPRMRVYAPVSYTHLTLPTILRV